MGEMWQAFLLGNAAILTNICILPLYPGLIAFMAGNLENERSAKAAKWLGLFVFAGILSLMLLVGGLLYLFDRSFGFILPWLLPIIYLVVILLGVLMLMGRNPFAKLQQMQLPALQNPYVAAFSYGFLLGPMTLPCAGPLVVAAFLLGSGSAAELGSSLLYFFFFGLGFGWPLILLPFVATALQKRFTRWMGAHHQQLTRVSGLLLIGIGLLGIFYDWLPVILLR